MERWTHSVRSIEEGSFHDEERLDHHQFQAQFPFVLAGLGDEEL